MRCTRCSRCRRNGHWTKSGVLILVIFATLTPAPMSGCGVNFEKMRKRRIEAIRGQILSKLGFTSLPSAERPPHDSVTPELEAQFNRTRDFVLEEARRKREECQEPEDSYYAQEVKTVYTSSQRSNSAESPQPCKYSIYGSNSMPSRPKNKKPVTACQHWSAPLAEEPVMLWNFRRQWKGLLWRLRCLVNLRERRRIHHGHGLS